MKTDDGLSWLGFEETATVDRALNKAANAHAGEQINMRNLERLARQLKDKKRARELMEMGKGVYANHYDSFVAGAKWNPHKKKGTP